MCLSFCNFSKKIKKKTATKSYLHLNQTSPSNKINSKYLIKNIKKTFPKCNTF